MIAIAATADRPPDAKPHGNAESFRSIARRCPKCGGKHLRLSCDDPTCDYSEPVGVSHHDGGTEPPTRRSVLTVPIRHHDGGTAALSPAGRLARLRRMAGRAGVFTPIPIEQEPAVSSATVPDDPFGDLWEGRDIAPQPLRQAVGDD